MSGRVPARYERLVTKQARAARRSKSDLVARSLRAGENHGGLILFRRSVRSTDYGDQAHLVTDFWLCEARGWGWTNRIVYLPKSP